MLAYLWILTIPSLLIVIWGKYRYRKEITYLEWCVQFLGLVVSTSICIGLLSLTGSYTTSDFDILNGQVTGKERVRVSCEHQYKCGETCSGTGKNRSCSPIYCDRHSYDVDWDVKTSVGDLTIERIDDQGVRKPPRWAEVKIGEPAAQSESVTNYLLVDDERFKTDPKIMEKYKGQLPDYPKPFDYYRFNRVINQTSMYYVNLNTWLNEQLKKYGKEKELNIILVITNKPDDYYYALKQHWRGVRKNDVILFYGIDKTSNVKWFRADSFADGQSNQILLKQLQSMTYEKQLNQALVAEQFNLIVKDYKRLPNEKFAYLMDAYEPPMFFIIMVMLVNAIVTYVIAMYFVSEDPFNTQGNYGYAKPKRKREWW